MLFCGPSSVWPHGWLQPQDIEENTFYLCVQPVSVPSVPGRVDSLPHLGSRTYFKTAMDPVAAELSKALAAKGIVYFYCGFHTCTNQHGLEHIGGPSHWKALWAWLDSQPGMHFDGLKCQCWQAWDIPGGGLAFNHIDGSVGVWSGRRPQFSAALQHPPQSYPRALPHAWGAAMPPVPASSSGASIPPPPPPPPPDPPSLTPGSMAESVSSGDLAAVQIYGSSLLSIHCQNVRELDGILARVRDSAIQELNAGRLVRVSIDRVTSPPTAVAAPTGSSTAVGDDSHSMTSSGEFQNSWRGGEFQTCGSLMPTNSAWRAVEDSGSTMIRDPRSATVMDHTTTAPNGSLPRPASLEPVRPALTCLPNESAAAEPQSRLPWQAPLCPPHPAFDGDDGAPHVPSAPSRTPPPLRPPPQPPQAPPPPESDHPEVAAPRRCAWRDIRYQRAPATPEDDDAAEAVAESGGSAREGGNPGSPLRVNEKVEARYGDSWLPASVYDIETDGQIIVLWESERSITRLSSCSVRRRGLRPRGDSAEWL